MKWYEEVLIMLFAISSNISVTITSPLEMPILVALTEVGFRACWTILVFIVIRWIYEYIRSFFTR